ncbi:MAG: ATP-binding protein [Bacteroidota bacterium]
MIHNGLNVLPPAKTCRKYFIIHFLLSAAVLIPVFGFSQSTVLDSLKDKIKNAQSATAKLNATLAFCNEWESMSPDTLYKYALGAKQSSMAVNNSDALLMSDYYLAAYLFQKNRIDTALKAIDAVLARSAKQTEYSPAIAKFWQLRGNILMRTFNYGEALKQDFSLLSLAEKNNDTVGMIRFSTGIGNVNLRLKKIDEALQWHYKAIALMQTDILKAKCSFVFVNLGVVYYHLAATSEAKRDNDSAATTRNMDSLEAKKYEDSLEANISKAITWSRQGGTLTNLANSLSFYGQVMADVKKIPLAEKAFAEALAIRKKIGDVFYEISDMVSFSAIYENDNAKAISICLKALDIAKANGSDVASLTAVYSSLAEYYLGDGNYKKYSEVLKEQMALRDSIYATNTASAVAEMEARYNVQKKETTILQQDYQLSKERTFRYAILGVILILLATFFLVARYKKNQQQQKLKELEMMNEWNTRQAVENAKEEERTRIIADLHDDVGGGLSTIRMVSDLIAEQKDQTFQLEQYAHKISGITKEVTQRMNIIVWALSSENDNFQNLWEYIRSYGFRFFEDTAIAFACDLPASMPAVQLSGLRRKNIFLCVKEALNNIYKHSGASRAWVSLSLNDGLLTLSIHDDGKGITHQNAFGNGLKNIKKRMEEINGSVEFTTTTYTSVVLKVPISQGKEI